MHTYWTIARHRSNHITQICAKMLYLCTTTKGRAVTEMNGNQSRLGLGQVILLCIGKRIWSVLRNLSTFIYFHLFIYLSSYLSTLSICQSIYLSFYLSIYQPKGAQLSIYLSITKRRPIIYLSIYRSICLSVYPPIYLSI